MKTFLKFLLLAVGAFVALKFLRLAFVPLIAVAAGLVAAFALLSGGAVLACVVALAAVAVLSPLWLPVLAVIGAVWLVRRVSAPRA